MTGVSVVKLGGDVVADVQRLAPVVADLATHHRGGGRAVVVHGGGPQATALTRRLGITPNVVGGRRITSPEVLEVMKMTLGGVVNVDLAAAFRAAGVPGLGVSGVSAGLVRARRRPPRVVSGCGDEPVDFGEVGDPVGVDAGAFGRLLEAGFLPLVGSLCADEGGRVLNINADVVACDIAIGLVAERLVLLTNIDGVMADPADPSSRFARLTVAEARARIADGTVRGGMIPKLEESFRVLDAGVGSVCIMQARQEGDLAAALSGSTALGTTLVL